MGIDVNVYALSDEEFKKFCIGHVAIEIGAGNFRTAMSDVLFWAKDRETRNLKLGAQEEKVKAAATRLRERSRRK